MRGGSRRGGRIERASSVTNGVGPSARPASPLGNLPPPIIDQQVHYRGLSRLTATGPGCRPPGASVGRGILRGEGGDTHLSFRDAQQFGHVGTLRRRQVLLDLELFLELEDLPASEGGARLLTASVGLLWRGGTGGWRLLPFLGRPICGQRPKSVNSRHHFPVKRAKEP